MLQHTTVALVARAMVDYFAGDIRRINHLLKVYGFAKTIGELEGLDMQTLLTLEVAALTHDIGIKVSQCKHKSAAGHFQELEGTAEARAMLCALAIPAHITERVCWLIAHHHTYKDIQGLDYQILVEADFLVNIHEDNMAQDAIVAIKQRIFRTDAGTSLLYSLYLHGGIAT